MAEKVILQKRRSIIARFVRAAFVLVGFYILFHWAKPGGLIDPVYFYAASCFSIAALF